MTAGWAAQRAKKWADATKELEAAIIRNIDITQITADGDYGDITSTKPETTVAMRSTRTAS